MKNKIVTENLEEGMMADAQLEQVVLGAMLMNAETVDVVYDMLTVNSFSTMAHKAIFEAITTLFKTGDSIDMLTVKRQVQKAGKLELVGGAGYIMALTDRTASSAHIETHCKYLIELAMKREQWQLAYAIKERLTDATADAFDVQDAIAGYLNESLNTSLFSRETSTADLFDRVSTRLVENVKLQGITGVPTGIDELDDITGGFKKGDLTYIGGRASMGKTMFATNLVMNAILRGYKVGFFSIESAGLEIVNRLTALELNRQGEKLSNSQLARSIGFTNETAQKMATRVTQDVKTLYAHSLFIDDRSTITAKEIRAKTRKWIREKGIDIVFVDYLQYITHITGNKSYTKHHEVSDTSRALKSMAKDLDIPVVALAQLSRDADNDGKNGIPPDKKHFKESGDIEQDGDLMLTLYRPEYYKVQDYNGRSSENLLVTAVIKNRDGALGQVMNHFNPAEGLIKNLTSNPF